VHVSTGVGLIVTLFSAAALNWAYLAEHRAASSLPPLSMRHPLHSLRLLLGNQAWLTGFLTEGAAWGLYVLALALAPLALVQGVSAGGIGVLAFLVQRVTGCALGHRERIGVAFAFVGLALLGISLAGGAPQGTSGEWLTVVLWLGASAGAATVAAAVGRSGPMFGCATGILFAAGDVATKTVVSSSARLAFIPVMVALYAAGTIVLQLGFQRGGALATAGTATLLTNALPIAAGMTIFGEPLPHGIYAVLRVVSFAAVVAGAVALARPDKTSDELTASGLQPATQS
jgi:hypothetical protein